MKCFCCGKETDAGNGWHPACVKHFFARENLPELELTAKTLEELTEDPEELALSLNGKKRNIRKKDFFVFAENCGIPGASAEKMMEKLVSLEDKYLTLCGESYLSEDMKSGFEQLIRERCGRLKG